MSLCTDPQCGCARALCGLPQQEGGREGRVEGVRQGQQEVRRTGKYMRPRGKESTDNAENMLTRRREGVRGLS